jgi:uncharacterized protein YebE (UPF0316 family)
MFNQKSFFASIVVGILLIGLHSVGSYFSWYWKYSFFDIIVHVVSGLWVSLLVLWLAICFGQINDLKDYKVKSFLIAFVSAILAGVFWEIFENIAGVVNVITAEYYLDTALDILNSGFGGVLTYLFFIRKRHCLDKSCEVLHPFHNTLGLIKN